MPSSSRSPDGARPTVVNATAPVRVWDNGGWTDTWFAGHGRVCNVAVRPGVAVQVVAVAGRGRIGFDVADFGDRYTIAAGETRPGRHPLLEEAVIEVAAPDGLDLEISVRSEVPPGSGTGTSAASLVALVAALDRMRGGTMGPSDVARAAHRVETERVGLQSGIQDQLAAVYGGVLSIEMHRYPEASVEHVAVSDELRAELDRRVVLVYLGRAHSSSAVHEEVIAALRREGERSQRLEDLRRAAAGACQALRAGDLDAFGRALRANTEAQQRLHEGLISADARTLIDLARDNGAAGWKVNGAGGDGGSVAILAGPGDDDRARLCEAIARTLPAASVIPVALSADGLRVWEGPQPAS